MMKKKLWTSLGLFAVLALLVAACGSPAAEENNESGGEFAKNANGYADITVEQLASMLEGKDFTLVNVHIPYDGELPETDLFIPYDQMTDYLEELPNKDATIVLYCRSGSMSTSAAQELAELGYTNVLEVDGGFNAWKAAGHELLDAGR